MRKSSPAAPAATNVFSYDGLAQAGRAALAWELLRRNPDYRSHWLKRRCGSVAADRAFLMRWGLHFRRGSRSIVRPGAHSLVLGC